MIIQIDDRMQELGKYLRQYSYNTTEECKAKMQEVGQKKYEILGKIAAVMGPFMNSRDVEDVIFKYFNPTLVELAVADIDGDNVKLLRGVNSLVAKIKYQ